MEDLKEWIEKQFREHLVEPNSNLGKALQYWRNHFSALVTQTHDGGEHNIVPLGRVANHLWLHGLSFGSFMQVIDSGFPRAVIEREGLPGRLSRFWFRVFAPALIHVASDNSSYVPNFGQITDYRSRLQ